MHKITAFIIGLFSVLLFSGVVFGDSSDITSPYFTIDLSNIDPVNQNSEPPVGSDAVVALLEKVATFLLFVMPLIAAVAIVIAGYYYILSSGDSEKANKAKTIIKWNAVAIVLALFSYALINFIASILENTI